MKKLYEDLIVYNKVWFDVISTYEHVFEIQ